MTDEIKTLIQALADAQEQRDNYRKSYEYFRDECKRLESQLSARASLTKNVPNGSEA